MFVAGPSFTVDSACSSSLVAVDDALRAIQCGQCDAAVVAGSNVILRPQTTFAIMKAGASSPDGKCKCLDASGARVLNSHRRNSWKLVRNYSQPGFPTSFQLVRLCGLRPLATRT